MQYYNIVHYPLSSPSTVARNEGDNRLVKPDPNRRRRRYVHE